MDCNGHISLFFFRRPNSKLLIEIYRILMSVIGLGLNIVSTFYHFQLAILRSTVGLEG